jgi:hypothetical protein
VFASWQLNLVWSLSALQSQSNSGCPFDLFSHKCFVCPCGTWFETWTLTRLEQSSPWSGRPHDVQGAPRRAAVLGFYTPSVIDGGGGGGKVMTFLQTSVTDGGGLISCGRFLLATSVTRITSVIDAGGVGMLRGVCGSSRGRGR